MKKFKKIFAVLMTLAMVLGMGMTSFATDSNKIIINGLSANGETKINVYKAVSLKEPNGNEWEIEEWAENKIVPGTELTETQIKALTEAVGDATVTYTEADGVFSSNKTTWTLSNVPTGAYVITATTKDGETPVATYTTMVASTYSATPGVVGKDAELTAKAESFTLTKDVDANDKVAAYGEEVNFTIQTTVPDLSDASSYTIKDIPDGLTIKNVKGITVGGTTFTNYTAGYSQTEEGTYVINLSNLIPTGEVSYTGQVLTITYTAEVTSENGYSNTANYYIDDVAPGEGDTEEGFTGSITVKKVDSKDDTVTLYGAKFEVTKVAKGDGKTDASEAPLSFVRISDGVYRLAKADDEETVTEVEVASETATNKGTVVVKGLEGGTYHFKETVAPEGYGINDNSGQESMQDVVITEANATEQSVAMSGNYINTKLGSLPGTGGIGTTIFTIGGCAIMIIAAALFFASRRKAAK